MKTHQTAAPATALEKRVAQVIADCTATAVERIVPAADLTADLTLDSLDLVEVIRGLEDEFNISIPDDVKVVTVADVIREVETLIEVPV